MQRQFPHTQQFSPTHTELQVPITTWDHIGRGLRYAATVSPVWTVYVIWSRPDVWGGLFFICVPFPALFRTNVLHFWGQKFAVVGYKGTQLPSTRAIKLSGRAQ